MSNVISLSNSLLYLEIYSARIPLASTINSFAHLAQKHLILPFLNKKTILENRYFTHLSYSSSWRQVALLFPFIGNIVVWIYDKYAAKQGEKLLQLALQEQSTNVDLYKQAAYFGNSTAILALGLLDSKNAEETVRAFRQAEMLGSSLAKAFLGFCYVDGTGVTQDIDIAVDRFLQFRALECIDSEIALLKQTAALKHPLAMTLLGLNYRDGVCCDKSHENAVKLFQEATQLGNPYAMACLALCYFEGTGIQQNLAKVNELLERSSKPGEPLIAMIKLLDYAAALGNHRATTFLGYLHRSVNNLSREEQLLKEAAQYKNAFAMSLLGFHYLDIKQNAEAMQWFQQAADLGETHAMAYLGFCHYDGIGVSKNTSLGLEMFIRSSFGDISLAIKHFRTHPSPSASTFLGYCYLEGISVSQDVNRGKALLKAAAEKNDFAKSLLRESFLENPKVAELLQKPFHLANALKVLGNLQQEEP